MHVAIAPPRLDVDSVSKTFGETQVLSDVHLTVLPGEVHGLVGQNGSGKSTLIKILTGYHRPDPGANISVDGAQMRMPIRWEEAHAAGVAVVHQDLGLIDQMTVAENICVGSFPTRRLRRIDTKARDMIAAEVLDRLEVSIHPRTLCGALSSSQRAEVAIARALRDQKSGGGLTILDESTRALTGSALTHFHELIRKVAASGGSILMISHNLSEVMSVSDRLTVLRDGEVAGAGLPTKQLNEAELATRMLGRPLREADERADNRGVPQLQSKGAPATVTELSAPNLATLSFQVERGEIIGITGLPGSGFETIPYYLGGGLPSTSGQLHVNGRQVDLTKGDVRASLRAGVVLVPERRDRDGLAYSLSAVENVALPSFRRRGRSWLVKRGWQRDGYARAVRDLDIRPPLPGRLVKELSGGNQQKVLLAKWMSTGPSLLVLHEPTQAVDVAAREDLLAAVRRAADGGVSVALVTAEPSDLAQICDRVLMYERESGLTELARFDPDSIISAVYGENNPSMDAKDEQ